MDLKTTLLLIGEISTLLGALIPVLVFVRKLSNGTKCQLRSEMLRIYYNNVENEKIKQYEYENFVLLYEAYKALKGNSFIDKIYNDIQKWEVIK